MSLPRYPEYKDSGLDWLGQVPSHWQIKRLRFVADLNPSKFELKELDRESDVSFLPMEAIGDDGSLSLERTRTLGEVETGYTYFRDGDVVAAKITPCFENGKGALMQGLHGGIGFGTTELVVARPKPDQVLGSFLSWLFRSPNFRKEGEANMYGAGGQKRVPDDFVRDFAWAMAPIDEQRAIADFLFQETSKLGALIAEQEKLLALLSEKRQAIISRAVTGGIRSDVAMKDSGITWLGRIPVHWKVVPIKFLSPVQRGASPRPIEDPKYFDDNGEYAWVRIADVSASDGLLVRTEQTLSDLGAGLSVKIESGSLFVSIAGTVGKPCITKIKACIHDGFVYFPALNIDPMLLFRIFEAGTCYAGLGKMGTQLNLNTDTIGSIRIALPPGDEIAEILQFIRAETEKLEELQANAERGIGLLKERRAALISAAVTGKIDVRGLA